MSRILLVLSLSTLLWLLPAHPLFAGPGDTTIVQTFTYGAPQEGSFLFPDSTHSWEKILMYYRLKCNPAQNPACGEWDYLTYSYLYDHTGKYDSILYFQPSFTLPGASPDSLEIRFQPTYQYAPRPQYVPTYASIDSLHSATIGSASHLFSASKDGPDGKAYWLFRAVELSAQGALAGDISGIRIFSDHPNSILRGLKIRLGHSTQDSLDALQPFTPAMSSVVDRDLLIPDTGEILIPFHQPFAWDGTSNLLVEMAYERIEDTLVLRASDAGFVSNMHTAGPQYYLNFEPYHYADLGDIDALDSTRQFTFEAWIKADNFRNWGNIFAKTLNNANRIGLQLGGNGNVAQNTFYCLVGNGSNAYGYTAALLHLDEWHHIAMVYDGNASGNTGKLKFYFDGVQKTLSYNGSIPSYTVNTQQSLTLSSPGNNSWDGDMDEVRIWDKALSAGEIQERMYAGLDSSDPLWGDLLAYYPMNEGSGSLLPDNGPNLFHGQLAYPVWKDYRGEQFREFSSNSLRPDIAFDQGIVSLATDTIYSIDSIRNYPYFIVLYDNPNDPTTPTDTLIAWPPAYTYLFDSLGQAIDSLLLPADSILYKTEHPYYGNPFEVIERYELGRFITPYGIGLDLGSGFTWIFDVSDFGPLLRDSVHLKAGNWQELLDMKFVMIEGTPPRDVHKIEKLWNGNYNLSTFDTQVPPRDVLLDASSEMYNVKITTTGHGFDNATNCAEFCYKIHSLDVEGGTRYSWQIMQECADNPLYPQGGTWIFDRAGWCPGAKGKVHNIDITEYVNPGDSVSLDYNCQYDPYGNYVVESYLVSYGAPNFAVDASIEEIIAPSTMKFHGRFNPICGRPLIRIRNNGSDTLTSLTFTYGLCNGSTETFQWQGSLAFLEEEVVSLPPVSLFHYDASQDPCFQVEISAPNGGADQYPFNNASKSRFELPPDFENPFIFRFRTNHAPNESAWWIEDFDGNTLFQNGSLQANTNSDDTISLASGCYKLMITDAGGNGLKFWYNMPPYGNGTAGYARIKSTLGGYYLHNFEPDFGNAIGTAFTIGHPAGIDENEVKQTIEVFPNPSRYESNVMVSNSKPMMTSVMITDLSGRILWGSEPEIVNTKLFKLPVHRLSPGIYIVLVKSPQGFVSRKLVVSA